ncbi:MAG: hypothetical protein ACRD3G_12245 [Vicinamibacterales bacterium]
MPALDLTVLTLLLRDDLSHRDARVLVVFTEAPRMVRFRRWIVQTVRPDRTQLTPHGKLFFDATGATIGFLQMPLTPGPQRQLHAVWLLDEVSPDDRKILAPCLTEYGTIHDVTTFGR